MLAAQITQGGTYAAKVSGSIVPVRVNSILKRFDGRPGRGQVRTVYYCTNLKTGRHILVRSAQRFRPLITRPS